MNLITEKYLATGATDIPCPLWRRIGAIFYDTILLIGVVFLAWQPVPLLPEDLYPIFGRGLRLGYLTAICFVFFGWFWCHGGQTLGMRAWKIKLVSTRSSNQPRVTWLAAWIRFISAVLSWAVVGMGFLWSLFHHRKLAWHDIFSETKLIVLPKN